MILKLSLLILFDYEGMLLNLPMIASTTHKSEKKLKQM